MASVSVEARMQKDQKRGRSTGLAKVWVGLFLVVSQTLFGSARATVVVSGVSDGSIEIVTIITNPPIPLVGGKKMYKYTF